MRIYVSNNSTNGFLELDYETLIVLNSLGSPVWSDETLGASYNKLIRTKQDQTVELLDIDTLISLEEKTITGGIYFAYYHGFDGDLDNYFYNNTQYWSSGRSQKIETETYTVIEEVFIASKQNLTAALGNGDLYSTYSATNEVIKQDKDTLFVLEEMGYTIPATRMGGADNTIIYVASNTFYEIDPSDGTVLRQETNVTKFSESIAALKTKETIEEIKLKKLDLKPSYGKTFVYFEDEEIGHTHLNESWDLQINKKYKEYKANYSGTNTAEKTLSDIELILKASLIVNNDNNILNSAYKKVSDEWIIKTDYIGDLAKEGNIRIVSAYDNYIIDFQGIIEIQEVYDYNNNGKAKMLIKIVSTTDDINKIRR